MVDQIDVDGDGNIVVGGDYFGPTPPLPTPSRGRYCYQCERLTWRHSQNCMHCDVDLFAHDLVVYLEGQIKTQNLRLFQWTGAGLLLMFVVIPVLRWLELHSAVNTAYFMVAICVIGLYVASATLENLRKAERNI